MTKRDIIFSAVCGFGVAFIALDLFQKYTGKYSWIFFVALPVLSVFGLWLADLIGKRFLFVRQAAKFSLAGGFADVFDVKAFQFLFWLMPVSTELTLIYKTISFLVGTFVKYFSDKYWTFEKRELAGAPKEMAKFFMVAIGGALINIVSFYFFVRIKTGLSLREWQETQVRCRRDRRMKYE